MTAPASARPPAVRPDVEFVLATVRGGRPRFLVRDSCGAVHALGEREVFLCRHLDGRTPLAEVRQRYEREFGAPLDDEALAAFVRQLGTLGLLSGAEAERTRLGEWLDPEQFLPVAQRRLGRGDRLLGWLARRLGWAFGRAGLVGVAALAAGGATVLVLRGRAFVDAVDAHWTLGFLAVVLALAAVAVNSAMTTRATASGRIVRMDMCSILSRSRTDARWGNPKAVVPTAWWGR